MDIKIQVWQAIALAPVVTILLLWVARSIKRLPRDIWSYFQAVGIWIRG